MDITYFLLFFSTIFITQGIKVRKCTVDVQPVTMNAFELADAPHWDLPSQRLYFVDLKRKSYHAYNPWTGKVTSVITNCTAVSFIIPVKHTSDKFIIGCGKDVALVKWDGKNETGNIIRILTTLEKNRDDVRLHIGKADRDGRLWTGTTSYDASPNQITNKGTLYRVGKDLRPVKVYGPVTFTEGIDWYEPTNRMYFVDSATRTVKYFTFHRRNGTISDEKILFDFNHYNLTGEPGGLTLDIAGDPWVTQLGTGRVLHLQHRTGALTCYVQLPVKSVVSIAFGGPFQTVLYITTANGFLFSAHRLVTVAGLIHIGRISNKFSLDN